MSDRSAFYRPGGSWSCTKDHVTEPCGDCDGCRQVEGENRIDAPDDIALAADDGFKRVFEVTPEFTGPER